MQKSPKNTMLQKPLINVSCFHISQADKNLLTREYDALDPVQMLAQLEVLQDQLWTFSWNINGKKEAYVDFDPDVVVQEPVKPEEHSRINRYYHTHKKTDLRKSLRTWRTRKDPFDKVWDEIRLRLELMPETTAKAIIEWLMVKYPNQFTLAQTRTLQRRIKDWRQAQQSLEERLRTILLHDNPGLPVNSLSLSSMKDTLNYNSDFDDFSSSRAHNRTRN